MKKTLHIISHSHWDREWYMPFEHHRYRLVELIDDVIELCENDPNFKYFHLDGQVIPIYDYLEVKPENKDRLINLIKKDQIQIGPWYLLQDAFLTSAESNVRNMLLGLKHTKLLGGDPVMIGYFPDTFGNISQAPQILKKFNIDVAAFGRGLNEVGFDNQIVKQDGLNKSEMIWESPDGSQVIGILFTNWYCNANDLPIDRDDLEERIGTIIENCEKFALTDSLLALNGCDHTPVQKDISQIVATAQELFPDYNIVHSNFKDYMDLLKKDTTDFDIFQGEIIGQLTTGYNLLNNTASTRVDIKQINYLTQVTLEKETEPISIINNIFNLPYDSRYIEHAWIKLIENHTHDSICSCSSDAVNDLVKTRLSESFYAAEVTRDEAVRRLIEANSQPSDNSLAKEVVVFNKLPKKDSSFVSVTVNFPLDKGVRSIKVLDKSGNVLPSTHTYKHNVFTYTLPKDSFRKVEYTDQFNVEFLAKDIPGLGYQTYTIVPSDEQPLSNESKSKVLENKFVKVKFYTNATFDFIDKKSKIKKENLGVFEYQANCGNEYNFEQTHDYLVIDSKDQRAKFISHIKNDVYQEITYETILKVPKGIEGKFVSKELVETKIITKARLYHNEKSIRFNTTFYNRAENARYRILFDPQIETDYVLSEGQFDLVKRPLAVWDGWKNPVKTNRFYNFFALEGQKVGALASGLGLHEYEILADNTMALTLVSGVDQMGDWGYFPTPNSQMIGKTAVDYIFKLYSANNTFEAYEEAYKFQNGKLITGESKTGNDFKNKEYMLAEVSNNKIIYSALKKAEVDDNVILRLYSISEESTTVKIKINKNFSKAELVNLNEDKIDDLKITSNTIKLDFKPKEIITIKLFKGEK